MRLNPANLTVQIDDEEADAVTERLRALFDADDTPTVCFMWDAQAECWLGICMWSEPTDEHAGGVNFTVDADTGALITGVFTALKAASRE